MKITRIEFAVNPEACTPAIVTTAYDKDGNQLFKQGAEYKTDPIQGVANSLEFISKVMNESFKDENGRPYTWFR